VRVAVSRPSSVVCNDAVYLFLFLFRSWKRFWVPPHRLTIPSRDDIVASPIRDDAPPDGITSSYYSGQTPQQNVGAGAGRRPPSPVIDDPSADLERELAGTHIGRK
jgi:hypothetical protein